MSLKNYSRGKRKPSCRGNYSHIRRRIYPRYRSKQTQVRTTTIVPITRVGISQLLERVIHVDVVGAMGGVAEDTVVATCQRELI